MRIALIGAPGSGKGTQAKLLAERYRIPHISSVGLLRDAAKSDPNFPPEALEAMDQGQLVDDEIIRELLAERLRRKDTKRGFVIDGYPRNIPQAQSLDNLLGMLGRALQVAVYTEVDDSVLKKRIEGRLNCGECGAIFNTFFSPPKAKGKCDHCGNKLEVRKDDNAKASATRLEVHKTSTTPLITYYRAQHKLRTVQASVSAEEIHGKICAIVDLEIRPLEIDALITAADSMDEEESTIIAGGQINKVAPSPEPARKPVMRPAPVKAAPVKKAKLTKGKAKTEAKPTAKPSSAKKAAAKKAGTTVKAVKKPSTKKVTEKKVATKKKATTKKAASKKVVAKKAAVKKPVAKKAVVKKAAKKTSAKKTVAKKTVTKKTASKKVATKKPVAKKSAAKKSVTKKATVAKAKPKKPVTKKAVVKKASAAKPAKKKVSKKAAKKKVAKKK